MSEYVDFTDKECRYLNKIDGVKYREDKGSDTWTEYKLIVNSEENSPDGKGWEIGTHERRRSHEREEWYSTTTHTYFNSYSVFTGLIKILKNKYE